MSKFGELYPEWWFGQARPPTTNFRTVKSIVATPSTATLTCLSLPLAPNWTSPNFFESAVFCLRTCLFGAGSLADALRWVFRKKSGPIGIFCLFRPAPSLCLQSRWRVGGSILPSWFQGASQDATSVKPSSWFCSNPGRAWPASASQLASSTR